MLSLRTATFFVQHHNTACHFIAPLWFAAAGFATTPHRSPSLSPSSSIHQPSRFSHTSSDMPTDTGAILRDLRALMAAPPTAGDANAAPLAAYIIPSDDAHQSEYISEHDERRRFVSGFDGSAGTAVITADAALLWTDGRYYNQALQQLDANWQLQRVGLADTPEIGQWLAGALTAGQAVGVDPAIVSTRAWMQLAEQLREADVELRAVDVNLVDAVWGAAQPPQTAHAAVVLSTAFAGRTVADKVGELRKKMGDRHADVLVVTALDEVAWLLNLRGSDIDYNPVFYAYVIVTAADVHLICDAAKLPAACGEQHFARDNGIAVRQHPYADVRTVLAAQIAQTTGKVWLGVGSSYALTALVPKRRHLQEITPIAVMKALKNATEAAGMRACHVRDGVALCQYFAWLEARVTAGDAVDEMSGAAQLEAFRKKQADFRGLSFPTISSSGPNGAVIHYHPAAATNRPIGTAEMYLCDSGAQYQDGTTDVTRTWHFGQPTAHQIACNTRVLKGQIGLGSAVFPNKVKGQFLDTLARKALWDVGLDYGHGTGHGIGHYLNVHEGPQGISFRVMPDDPGLQANMFVSNEPGYYEDGQFGIRIEDIVQIVPAADVVQGDFGGRGALRFHTVTLCPIQTKLVDVALLTVAERDYLNGYHGRVWAELSPLLESAGDTATLEWLRKETLAI